MPDRTLLDSTAFIPDVWLRSAFPSDLRIYNPAIVRFRGRLLVAYRVDSGRPQNRTNGASACVNWTSAWMSVPGSVFSIVTANPAAVRHLCARVLRNVSFFHSYRPVGRLRWVLRYWPVTLGAKLPRILAAIERRLRWPFAQVPTTLPARMRLKLRRRFARFG